MVSILQVVRFVLGFTSAQWSPGLQSQHDASKSIAIIGAGSAGLASLKTLLDLPPEIRESWDIVLYEQREDVAGVWLPDPHPVQPPKIPFSPLYPLLHTNTPVPSMTYPSFPFPPGTPLYPSHEHIRAYHSRYASHHNLLPHIKFHHTVIRAEWVGDGQDGLWNITVSDRANRTHISTANHLIVASGNHHIPRTLSWPGQKEWLKGISARGDRREITHSVYYRSPVKYTGRVLLIIGSAASAQDAAVQTVNYTQRTYLSARHEVILPPGSDEVVVVPDVSHFTPNSVVFVDGTELSDIDSVLLATGYVQRKPFLEAGGVITVDPQTTSNSSSSGTLTTNLRYIFPLHRHILSLSPEHPTNALAFIGLPTRIANCPSDIAQSLFVAHAIVNPSILPDRKELLKDLTQREEQQRRHGYDPYTFGHAMLDESPSDYQDSLVKFLKEKGAMPDDGKPYVERWRRDIFSYAYLKRGWKRIETLGEVGKWLEGVETEENWSELMSRVNSWQQQYEEERGIPFVHDLVIGG
ncbi:dimethylaniline monooxygenase [Coprinopsis cinerea okayama7|uniref:Dimethylaniline monooxygenase n=1 Tax=Coprinopsis cinerea (strain Okayama-7 / 130 / ATCC MYA-4618 / FGSC 9003) TaxID=240176 RepID=D6RK35_COPC7|nr:dimethylaniline monooxygenase [Coprinopsis cinerea okayama7\|eukprot:XP_002912101.1 dimethylaniline monooxygenase [Coprinopsis cinerea okayama7\